MAIEAGERADGAVVALSGSVGLQEIQELKRVLEAAMRNPAGMTLVFEGLCGIDVSVLQLIHAMMCAGRGGSGRTVRVSGVPAEVVQQAADAGGGGVGCGRVCGSARCVFESAPARGGA